MKICLALGFFDSVHIGHRQLLQANLEHARSKGATAVIHTFSNDISKFFGQKQMYSFDRRKQLLSEYADLIITSEFNQKLMETAGVDFLDELTNRYEIASFTCGYDYTFGKNAECNADDLVRYAKSKGKECVVVKQQSVEGRKVSTTWIKELLTDGDVQKANYLLGKPFAISGEVIHGKGLGGKNGFPTANLSYDGFLPKYGVYKTYVYLDGKKYVAVTNVGTKPTFGDDSVTIEPMIIDFSEDIYGKSVTLEFVRFLRGVKNFSSPIELKEQINQDVKEALCSE